MPEFEPGFAAFGEIGGLGAANELHEQAQFLDPTAHGMSRLGGTQKLNYDTRYVFGATDDSADDALTFELDYELRFRTPCGGPWFRRPTCGPGSGPRQGLPRPRIKVLHGRFREGRPVEFPAATRGRRREGHQA